MPEQTQVASGATTATSQDTYFLEGKEKAPEEEHGMSEYSLFTFGNKCSLLYKVEVNAAGQALEMEIKLA